MNKKRIKEFWRRYKRNKGAVISLGIFVVILMVGLFAPYISPYSPIETGTGDSYEEPSEKHLMGTDELGRDIFSGVVGGVKVTLLIGFLASGISVLIGTFLGTVSAYAGGKIDYLIMRIAEILMVVPKFVFALVMVYIFGRNIWNVATVVGLLIWPDVSRVVRSEVLSLKERGFVEAARSIGANEIYIMFSEILPNAAPSIIVIGSLFVARAILLEAGLSFLGAGDPNVMSWGLMLRRAQEGALFMGAWWMIFFPGIAILLTVLSFNLIGDGLNDALNPKLREL